mmetsp:Transcript_1965/g.5524  ORF Transcript_1965/g.5524 Transcript_1965/m.5524 type:complete len:207 (+) Transcript_1965:1066-1686(+)
MIRIRLPGTMKNGLQAQHDKQDQRQRRPRCVAPVAQVGGYGYAAEAWDEVSIPDADRRPRDVVSQPLTHAADVDKGPGGEDDGACAERVSGRLASAAERLPHVIHHGLGVDEHKQGEDEPRLPKKERAEGDTAPDKVCDHGDHGMADDLWVVVGGYPFDGRGELPLGVDNEVLDVIVHSSEAVFSNAGAPDQAVQEHRNQRGRVAA